MAPKAVLIGLPGSGKSTIGRRLAKAMGCALIDTDAVIEERTGRSIPEIFAAEGESGFRQIEEQAVCDALRDHDGILSLGGGAVTTAGVREALAGHTVVYLEISATEGVRRTSGSTIRPLLAGPDRAEKYRELMTERVPLYRKVATIRINTNRRNPGAVVRYIVGRLEDPPPPRRRRPPWRRPAAPSPAPPQSSPAAASSDAPAESGPVTPGTLARRAGVRK
ncbi:MAG: shikimate kinase [Mycobacteriaceae bacterium]